MSNYPDNFTRTNMDAPALHDILPADAQRLYAAQAAYRECVEACVDIFRKRGFTGMKMKAISSFTFDGIEDALESCVATEIANFYDAGVDDLTVRGDDDDAFFARMYGKLKSTDATEATAIETRRAAHAQEVAVLDFLTRRNLEPMEQVNGNFTKIFGSK